MSEVEEKYYAGKGCTCATWSESECGCGADWTDPEIYMLRVQLKEKNQVLVEMRSMKKHIDNAKRALAILDNILNTLDDLEIKHLETLKRFADVGFYKELQIMLAQKIQFREQPYLSNHGDGVDGHYCICRMHKNGYQESWDESTKTWRSAGTVYELGKAH